jgi:hypothetical protein
MYSIATHSSSTAMVPCFCKKIFNNSIKDDSKIPRDPTIEEMRLYCRPKLTSSGKKSISSSNSINSFTSSVSNSSKLSSTKRVKPKEKGIVITVKKQSEYNMECPFSTTKDELTNTKESKQENDTNQVKKNGETKIEEYQFVDDDFEPII